MSVEIVDRKDGRGDRSEPAFVINRVMQPMITLLVDVDFATALSTVLCRTKCDNKAIHAFALTLRDYAADLKAEYYESDEG